MNDITSPSEFEEWARERDAYVFGELELAGQMGLDLVTQRMRQTTAFRDVTGNLRASIGHPGPYAPSVFSISFGEVPLNKLVERLGEDDGILITLPIGMEYAADVAERSGFPAEALGEAQGIFEDVFNDALASIERGLKGMA